jgi:hypothetical protein
VTNQGVVFDFLRVRNPDSGIAPRATLHPASERSATSLGDLFFAPPQLLPDFLSQRFLDLKVPDSQLRTGRLALPDSRFPKPNSPAYDRLVFSEEFVGANPKPEVEASGCQPGIYNYFIGNDPKNWHTRVKGYSEIVYRDLWPGIDLRLYGNGIPDPQLFPGERVNAEGGRVRGRGVAAGAIEQEFIVRPGADVTKVQAAYHGIESLKIAENGSLVVKTAFGDLSESKPRIYQEVAGKRMVVEGHFKLTTQTAYTFEVRDYHSQYALVIDPTLLYSTFLGGSAGVGEQANGIAVDSSGNAYVAGVTGSNDFPTTTGSFQPACPYCDNTHAYASFITKFNPVGSALIYSTYLSGGR